MKGYEEQGYPFDKAVHLAANDDLPILRKRLRQDYTQFSRFAHCQAIKVKKGSTL